MAAPASTRRRANSAAFSEVSSHPARCFTVTGMCAGSARRTEATRAAASSGSRISAEPQAPAVTFLAGQPMLMSTTAAPTSTAIPAARAKASGSRPKIWTAKRRPSKLGHIRPIALAAPRVSASAERNSVNVSAAPSSSQTVRNGRSVTASIGASNAPGLISTSAIRMRAWQHSTAVARVAPLALAAALAGVGGIGCRRAAPAAGAVDGDGGIARSPSAAGTGPEARRRQAAGRCRRPVDLAARPWRHADRAGSREHRPLRAGAPGRSDVAALQYERPLLDGAGRDRLGPRRRHRPRSAARGSGRRRPPRHHRDPSRARQGRRARPPRAVRAHAHARRSARARGPHFSFHRRARAARGFAPRWLAERRNRNDLLALPRPRQSHRRQDRPRAARERTSITGCCSPPPPSSTRRTRRPRPTGGRAAFHPGGSCRRGCCWPGRAARTSRGSSASTSPCPALARFATRAARVRQGTHGLVNPISVPGILAAPGVALENWSGSEDSAAPALERLTALSGARRVAVRKRFALDGDPLSPGDGASPGARPPAARCSSICGTSAHSGCSKTRFRGCSGPTRWAARAALDPESLAAIPRMYAATAVRGVLAAPFARPARDSEQVARGRDDFQPSASSAASPTARS